MPDIAVVAIDWGTTHLRIWPLDRAGALTARHTSAEGMSTLKQDQYQDVLEHHLKELGVAPDVPVIICGMAGARQGWVEAPYCSLPVDLSALADHAIRFDAGSHSVAMLPGAAKTGANAPDVMRSEETQLAGLVAHGLGDGLVCMPGTHTKWAVLERDRLVEFQTTMTGELFHLMESHSILSHSVGDDDIHTGSKVFVDAVEDALAAPEQVTTKLFSLRASGLFGHMDAQQIRTRLSGLLIGLDVAAALGRGSMPQTVVVVGGNRLGEAYCAALAVAERKTDEHDGESLGLWGLAAAARQLWPDRFHSNPMHQGRAIS